MTMRVAVAISGGGSNLQALLDSIEPEAKVVLVLSNRAGAGGLERAASRGVDTSVLQNPGDAEEWLQRLAGARVDLVVLAGYLKLVPAGVIERYPGRIINIHPALLPDFGGPGMYGLRVHEAVLARGDTVTGATVHVVDEVYDRGQILARARVTVQPGDTPEELARRVLAAEHRLLPEVVRAAARAGHPVQLEDQTDFDS